MTPQRVAPTLDNFLTPVVKALGGGEAFAFVWATRGRASDRAFLTITRATDVRLDSEGGPSHRSVRLSVSPERPEWKAALAAAVGRHVTATGRGPVELALRFGVSPKRNWVTLPNPTCHTTSTSSAPRSPDSAAARLQYAV